MRQFSGLEHAQLVVVWGARKEEMEAPIQQLKVEHTYNADWAMGMGTAIKCGVSFLLQRHAQLEAIIVSLVDQVFVEKEHIDIMLETHQKESGKIIAAHYNGIMGVPALFPQAYFDELQSLAPQKGAGALIKKLKQNVIPFPLAEASFDVDTEEDYQMLMDGNLPFVENS